MNIFNLIKYIILFFIIIFFETNVIHLFAVLNTTPDLVLIFVLIISLKEPRSTAIIFAFFAGLVQDAFITQFFGLSALSKLIVVLLGTFFQQAKKKYDLVHFTSTFAFLIFTHEFIYQMVYSLGNHLGFFRLLFYYIFPKTLYTLVVSVMVYLMFHQYLWKSKTDYTS